MAQAAPGLWEWRFTVLVAFLVVLRQWSSWRLGGRGVAPAVVRPSSPLPSHVLGPETAGPPPERPRPRPLPPAPPTTYYALVPVGTPTTAAILSEDRIRLPDRVASGSPTSRRSGAFRRQARRGPLRVAVTSAAGAPASGQPTAGEPASRTSCRPSVAPGAIDRRPASPRPRRAAGPS
jgi:hypothetical protein